MQFLQGRYISIYSVRCQVLCLKANDNYTFDLIIKTSVFWWNILKTKQRKRNEQRKPNQQTNTLPPKHNKKQKQNKKPNKTNKQTKQKHVLGLVDYDQSYFVVIQRWTKCGHNDEQVRYLMRGINGEKLGLKCLNVGKILTI